MGILAPILSIGLHTYEYLCHDPSMLPDTHSYLEDHKVSIGDAARITGVSISTLRRWERQGLIEPTRTLGGQRRYSVQALRDLQPEDAQRSQVSA